MMIETIFIGRNKGFILLVAAACVLAPVSYNTSSIMRCIMEFCRFVLGYPKGYIRQLFSIGTFVGPLKDLFEVKDIEVLRKCLAEWPYIVLVYFG